MRKYGALGGTITESVLKSVTQVQQQANAHSVCPADKPCAGISFSYIQSHKILYTSAPVLYIICISMHAC